MVLVVEWFLAGWSVTVVELVQILIEERGKVWTYFLGGHNNKSVGKGMENYVQRGQTGRLI